MQTCISVRICFEQHSTNLYFFSIFTNYLHQPGQQVRHSSGRDRLLQGSEYLERTASVVTWWAAQSCLQSHAAELLLQVETWRSGGKGLTVRESYMSKVGTVSLYMGIVMMIIINITTWLSVFEHWYHVLEKVCQLDSALWNVVLWWNVFMAPQWPICSRKRQHRFTIRYTQTK